MINAEKLKEQLKQVKALSETINKESIIFEKTIQEAIKGAQGSDKKKIEDVSLLCKRALSLAKQGKMQESQEMIKKFQNSYGGQNNR